MFTYQTPNGHALLAVQKRAYSRQKDGIDSSLRPVVDVQCCVLMMQIHWQAVIQSASLSSTSYDELSSTACP